LKKAKIIIVIILILLVILAITLLTKLNKEKEVKEWAETIDEDMGLEEEVEEHIIPVRGMEEFASIEKIMSNYNLYVRMGNKEAVYQVLTDNFKRTNNINSSNEVINVAKRMTGEEKSFRVREMYNKDSLTNPIYLVYGISETKQNGKEVYALVYVDNQYSTFAIEPITKTKYENYLTEKTEITPIDIIAKNNFNQYTKTALEDEDINEKYFDTIIREMLYHPEYAYTRLDSEYQKARFTTINSFKEYINEHKEELESMLPDAMKQMEDFATTEEYTQYVYNYEAKGMKQYRVDNYQDYTQYTFIDDYNNYYIIKATAPMHYTLLLDTYTVDLAEFTEKYNKATIEEKVQLNLVKIFNAINEANYQYAYSKLNDSFRKNNFPTLADFEKYVKESFYANCSIGVTNFQTYDYVYRYDVTIKNADQPSSVYGAHRTFSMILGEGTEYEYSFNIEND